MCFIFPLMVYYPQTGKNGKWKLFFPTGKPKFYKKVWSGWYIFGLSGKLRSESKEIIKNNCFWTYLCYCLISHRKKKVSFIAEYIITGSTQFQYISGSCIQFFAWYGNLSWSHKYIIVYWCFEPWGTIVGKWQKTWYIIEMEFLKLNHIFSEYIIKKLN